MIELSQTLSPPVPPEVLTPPPGILTAKEYLTVAGGVLAAGDDRPDFLQEVIDAIEIDQGEARCHYISYKVICLSVVGAINQGLSNPQAFQLLSDLYNSVYAFMYTPQPAAFSAHQSISNIISQAAQGAGVNGLLSEAISLLVNLNSSISNLRAGDQNWNASIQYQYDPSHWWYAESSRVYWDETGEKKQLPPYTPNLTPGDFYLNSRDMFRLQYLVPLADFLPDIGVYTAQDEYGNPFMYSSNNAFALPERSEEYRSILHFEAWV